jgi:tRNA nucleotidyltransferase (CCA-adding enzyme)
MVVVSAGRHGCGLTDGSTPSQISACLESVPEDALVAEWLALPSGAEARVTIERFLADWRWVRQQTDGTQLQQLGLAVGPAYGQILSELRAAWLDGRIRSEAEEHGLLIQLIEEYGRRG